MRAALGQLECVVGDVAANCAMIAEMVRDAAGRGCDVVWFPELADTGYALAAMGELAGTWPGPAYDAVASAAREHGITVGCGLSERAAASGGGSGGGSGGDSGGDHVFNSLAVLGSDGTLWAKYRKAHLFAIGTGEVNEAACFAPGSETRVVELGGLRHGLSICYDLRFPELYRKLAADGAEVLVNTTAWPNARPTHWEILTRARAVENQAYFVGAARVGCDEGITLNGASRIVNPMGEVVVEGSLDRAELVVGEIDPAQVSAFRALIPALGARRDQLFRGRGR